MAYKSLSDARAAFDKAMSSGKATASDWGSYYHNTASDSSGSKVTNSGAALHVQSRRLGLLHG